MHVRFFWVPFGIFGVLAACGGNEKPAKSSHDSEDGTRASIADLAAANGGLLGPGSNANGHTTNSSGVFAIEQVDKDNPIKLDGMLGEWPARVSATTSISGTANGTTFACSILTDDARIYFGGEVGSSSTLVRTARFGDDEDHASLILAIPSTGSLTATEIGFFVGKIGESSGVVKFLSGAQKGHEVPGSKIVEAPAHDGYSFEASFPWSTFSQARTTRVGLRGAARYYDAAGSNGIKSVLATNLGDVSHPNDLSALPNEGESSLFTNLIVPKSLPTTPKADVYADINGDGMKERIAVYDHFLTVTGSNYRHGKEFFYRDLGADLVHLEARAITGRNKDDLLVRRKFPGASDREWLEVWSFFSDEPTITFAHEISVTNGEKQIANAVRLLNKEIEITYEPAKGWDPNTYREPIASDVDPVLLPWGGIKSQMYKFDGSKFTKSKEVTQKPTGPTLPSVASTLPASKPQEPATPTVRTGTDLAKSLFDKYKVDHGIAAETRAKVDLEVQLDGSPQNERAVLIGRDIVVFGPGFKNGTAYSFLTLSQFSDENDVREMTARDLTGDGAAELIVRGRRHVSAAGQGQVDMDVLFVYQMKNEILTRVFSIETGREQSGKRVQGLVQFVPSSDARKFEIDVRPGRATGFTEKTYPWAQEQAGAGAFEPLLLPWGKIDHLRYAWNGSQFSLAP